MVELIEIACRVMTTMHLLLLLAVQCCWLPSIYLDKFIMHDHAMACLIRQNTH